MTHRKRVLIGFRPAGVLDAGSIANSLCSEQPVYLRFFHPFPLEEPEIRRRIENAVLDVYVLICDQNSGAFIGFYMLRGLDEGYQEPMLGLYVSSAFSGIGIASLATKHATLTCRLNGLSGLELKVYADNDRALSVYSALGFRVVSTVSGIVRMRKHWDS